MGGTVLVQIKEENESVTFLIGLPMAAGNQWCGVSLAICLIDLHRRSRGNSEAENKANFAVVLASHNLDR